jgi:hypothetical protein
MISLSQGLQDISKELGESTTNTSTRRIQAYNDAVVDLSNGRKYSFLVKKDVTLDTGDGLSEIDISTLTDLRMPGGFKEITVDGEDDPFKPVDYENRLVNSGKNLFYVLPDEQSIKFTKELEANKTLTIWHWYIPERIEDTTSIDQFPIPARYRKALGTLGACYVQWSRYLEKQGNRLYNIYQRLLETIDNNQAERSEGTPRRLPSYPQWRGQFRRYSYGSRSR